MKIGIGSDIHKLKRNAKLMIGGVNIPSKKGAVSYSDGDVLIHSLIDAILGALNKKDIGELFPSTERNFKNIESSILLKKVNEILKEEKYKIVNIDTIISLEEPKLVDYKDEIALNLANLLKIDKNQISIKAKTNEKFDSIGKKKAISCLAIILLEEVL